MKRTRKNIADPGRRKNKLFFIYVHIGNAFLEANADITHLEASAIIMPNTAPIAP
jgi:hypothetical protein